MWRPNVSTSAGHRRDIGGTPAARHRRRCHGFGPVAPLGFGSRNPNKIPTKFPGIDHIGATSAPHRLPGIDADVAASTRDIDDIDDIDDIGDVPPMSRHRHMTMRQCRAHVADVAEMPMPPRSRHRRRCQPVPSMAPDSLFHRFRDSDGIGNVGPHRRYGRDIGQSTRVASRSSWIDMWMSCLVSDS